ncbi:hypothetical protein CHUAL_003813 [Chamberlinius hualienensis]
MSSCLKQGNNWRWTEKKLKTLDLKLILWTILVWTEIVQTFPTDNILVDKKSANYATQISSVHAHDSHLNRLGLCETERTTKYFSSLHEPVNSHVFFHPSNYLEIKCKNLINPTFNRQRHLSDSENTGVCSRLQYYASEDNDEPINNLIHARLRCIQRFHVVPYFIVTETSTTYTEGTATYVNNHMQFNLTSTIVPYGCECLPYTTT